MVNTDKTRDALLTAAIRLFGQYGFSAVSTRQLATMANANIAAIKYHFGSKDDLYRAAIDAIVEQVSPRLDAVELLVAQAKSVAGDDRIRQAQCIAQIVDTVLETLLASERLRESVPFVVRELFSPGPHFQRLYDGAPRRLHERLTDLVAWILKLEADSIEAKVRSHAVVGQIIIYHIGRPILLARLAQPEYDDAVIHEIRSQAKRSILASLSLPDVD